MKNSLFFILILILISVVFYWPRFAELKIASDALEYHQLAINLLEGRGFYLAERGGLTMFREPGYPFFLFLNYKIFGVHPNLIRLEQIFLVLAIIFLAYKLTLKIFKNELIAKSAALLIALHPLFVIYSGELISEILATFLIILFCWILAESFERSAFWLSWLAGLILGILILIKSIFFFIPIFILPLYFIFKTKKWLLKLFLFLFGVSILVAPWLLRNHFYFNKWAVAERGGFSAYVHTSRTLLVGEQFRNFIVSGFLSQYFVRLGDPSFDLAKINVEPANQKGKDLLERGGYSKGQADDLLLLEAKKLWLKYPVKNFLIGFLESSKANAPTVPRNSIIFVYDISGSVFWRFLKAATIILIRLFWWIFLLVVFYGVWLAKNKAHAYLPILFIFYLNGLIFFLEGVPRFIFPIYPFYFIFFVFGAYCLMNKIWPDKFSRIN